MSLWVAFWNFETICKQIVVRVELFASSSLYGFVFFFSFTVLCYFILQLYIKLSTTKNTKERTACANSISSDDDILVIKYLYVNVRARVVMYNFVQELGGFWLKCYPRK